MSPANRVTAEACDTILKAGYASRLPAMGAFEHADLAGLDLINSKAAKAVWADLSNVSDPAETPVGELFEAGKLGMKTGAIKVAIHRLRRSFGDAVRTEIAQTVDDPEDVSEELRYLIEVLS